VCVSASADMASVDSVRICWVPHAVSSSCSYDAVMRNNYYWRWSISLAARSKAWVCGRTLAGIVGSNPAGGVDICLL
jgi:hypothetical protein